MDNGRIENGKLSAKSQDYQFSISILNFNYIILTAPLSAELTRLA